MWDRCPCLRTHAPWGRCPGGAWSPCHPSSEPTQATASPASTTVGSTGLRPQRPRHAQARAALSWSWRGVLVVASQGGGQCHLRARRPPCWVAPASPVCSLNSPQGCQAFAHHCSLRHLGIPHVSYCCHLQWAPRPGAEAPAHASLSLHLEGRFWFPKVCATYWPGPGLQRGPQCYWGLRAP